MTIRILHFVDYYLPETMNWIQRLVQSTGPNYVHHFCAQYYHPGYKDQIGFWSRFGSESEYPVPTLKKIWSRAYSLVHRKNLEDAIALEKIDILHFHFGHVALHHFHLIRLMGRRCVVSLYGFDYEFLVHKKPEVKRKYAEMADCGACFITEGNYSSRLLESYHIPRSKIRQVHMLFLEKFPIQIRPLSHPCILFQAASYTEKKGQDVLLKALANSRSRHHFRLILNGETVDPVYHRELEQIIRLNKLENVTLGPKISTEKYFHLLQASHFICNLSKRSKWNDTEGGIPVLLKDALCAGKPVLSTFHCDIPDTVVSGYNGFLFDENDDLEVSQCLDHISAMSPKAYVRLSYHAAESVRMKLLAEITARELQAIYLTLL